MVDGLDAYKTMTAPYFTGDTYSSAGLVDTQIATIKWASNALNVWAQGILQGNSSGYVPSFNIKFYGEQLGLYFQQFKSLLDKMKTTNTLSEINELIKERQAINAGVEESTTMVSMDQTIDTIESAASGMSYALQAMKRLNGTIVEAGFGFQDALDDYYAQKRREAIWNLAFGVSNLCTGGVRTFANIYEYKAADKDDKKSKESNPAKKGADRVSSVGFFVETVANNVKTMGFAASALVSANNASASASDQFPSDDSVALTNNLIQDLEDNDVLLPTTGCDSFTDCDIPDGDEMDALQAGLDALNEELPTMGWGFWTEYYAKMKEEYNEYLTGYSTSINAAAQHIIDLIDAQKDYGNDYVNQGMRYVGGLQQYLIDAQTIGIYRQANDALAAAYDDKVRHDYFPLQQSTQAVQITSLGLQMQALALQLCQSYSYQTTGLFQRCVARSTAPKNPLHELCYDFSTGVLPTLAPMELDPCGDAAGFIEEANKYLAPYDTINKLSQAVNCYVDRVLWGGKDGGTVTPDNYPFAALKVEVFNASCTPLEPPSIVTNMTSCVTSDCPCGTSVCLGWKQTGDCSPTGPREPENDKGCATTIESGWSGFCDCGNGRTAMETTCDPPQYDNCELACSTQYNISECDDDAVLKCFPASGAECQAFNASLDGGFAEDETCCESRYETFNCTSPPRVEPEYNDYGVLISDGYTLPYITEAQLKNFSDPDSPSFGKLVIDFPVAYMRQNAGLGKDRDEVFVRGIAAYLEGATLDASATKFKVKLTAKGEMTNQVKKAYEAQPEECVAPSCLFDDYSFAGAPSGESYPPSTVEYTASYSNWDESKRCGDFKEQSVFTADNWAAESGGQMTYCTLEDYEKSYESGDPGDSTGPYNSASLFSSFELTVFSDDSARNNWGIDLSGVTAIHIGFWLMTTLAPVEGLGWDPKPEDQFQQCKEMSSTVCHAAFTGEQCSAVQMSEFC